MLLFGRSVPRSLSRQCCGQESVLVRNSTRICHGNTLRCFVISLGISKQQHNFAYKPCSHARSSDSGALVASDQTVGVIGRTSRSGTRKEPGFRPDSGNGMYKKTMLREHDAGVGQDPIKYFHSKIIKSAREEHGHRMVAGFQSDVDNSVINNHEENEDHDKH